MLEQSMIYEEVTDVQLTEPVLRLAKGRGPWAEWVIAFLLAAQWKGPALGQSQHNIFSHRIGR